MKLQKMSCLGCGEEFQQVREWQIFCSDSCRIKKWKKLNSDISKTFSRELKEIKSRLTQIENKIEIKIYPPDGDKE